MHHNIVLIDDNFAIRQIIKIFLTRLSKKYSFDLNVFTSDNGVEGLGYVFITNPNIIIVDTTLPKYSGRDIIEFFVQNSKFRSEDIQVIVLEENPRKKLNLPRNFHSINKNNQNSFDELTDVLIEKLNISDFGRMSRLYDSLGGFVMKYSNKDDILSKKISNKIRIKNIFYTVKWAILEILITCALGLIMLVFGKPKDDNISQSRLDRNTFRTKYYPTLALSFVSALFIIINVTLFAFSQFSIYRNNLLETRALTTFYFDASDATPTQVGSAWSDEDGIGLDDAFDGTTVSYAYANTSASNGSLTDNYIHGEGTNAPTTGGVIQSVSARIYAIEINVFPETVHGAVYSDGLDQLLGEATFSGTTADWGSYTTLSEPTGGWTWQKINDLEIKIYATNIIYQSRIYKAEILVESTLEPEPTSTNTPVPTATDTPIPTTTDTPVPSATFTPVPTATHTPVPTATNTPVPTATNTPIPTATFTPIPTPTNSPVPTSTNTPIPILTSEPPDYSAPVATTIVIQPSEPESPVDPTPTEIATDFEVTSSPTPTVSPTSQIPEAVRDNLSLDFSPDDAYAIPDNSILKSPIVKSTTMSITQRFDSIVKNSNIIGNVIKTSINLGETIKPITDNFNYLLSLQFIGAQTAQLGVSTINILALTTPAIITIFSQPKVLYYALAWFWKRRSKQPWGIVFDKDTGAPIAFASLVLSQNGKTISTQTTDLQGKYGFTANKGNYQLYISHSDYLDFVSDIVVHYDGEIISQDFEVTAKSRDDVSSSFRWNLYKFKKQIANNLFIVNTVLFSIGFVYTLFAITNHLTVINYVILSLYLLQFILMFVFYFFKDKEFGQVTDISTGLPVAGAIVRVFNDERQIDVTITDNQGRYSFILEPGNYYLRASANGYIFPSDDSPNITHDKLGGKLLKFTTQDKQRVSIKIYMRKFSSLSVNKEAILSPFS